MPKTKRCQVNRILGTRKKSFAHRKILKRASTDIALIESNPIFKKNVSKLQAEFYSRMEHYYASIPRKLNKFFYSYKINKDENYGRYYAHHHEHTTTPNDIIFDPETLSRKHAHFSFSYVLAPNESFIAYAIDLLGDRVYTLYIKPYFDKPTIVKKNVSDNLLFSPDSSTLYYFTYDGALLNNQLWAYDIRSSKHGLVYEEKNKTRFLGLTTTNDLKHSILVSSTYNANGIKEILNYDSEYSLKEIFPLKENIEYQIDHHNGVWYVLHKNRHRTRVFKTANIFDTTSLSTILPNRGGEIYQQFIFRGNYMVVSYLQANNGFTHLYVVSLCDHTKCRRIVLMDNVRYSFSVPNMSNLDIHDTRLILKYTTFITPNKTLQLDLHTLAIKSLPQHDHHIKGYTSSNYVEEIIYVNKHLAMTVLFHKRKYINEDSPCVLYGYGSYGYTIQPHFDKYIISLLDRGFIYCFAHVRGSEFHGPKWYDQGKMLHKKNTFRDFVACAKYLIQHGYTSPQKLTIWGRSAGGLLMGSVVNTHPELFNLVMMGVPFLDVLDTMNDPCLPLVTNEYHEWGNPRFQKVSSYMASYSPLDNINLHNDFPNIYIYTNQHDTLVPYSGPLKYYNKLRHAETFKQGTRKLLFNMQTANGHNQSTMRYSETREYAFLFAIILYFNHLYE